MNNKRSIVVYGGSLIISTIGTFFNGRDDLNVIQVDVEFSTAMEQIRKIYPDVVIFDLATVTLDAAVSLFEIKPGLLLIGINMLNGSLLKLCGHHTRAMTASDLIGAVQADERFVVRFRKCD